TVNGRVETDFPVKIIGKISPRHLHGTVGSGGPALKLVTVNGSITLREAALNPNPTPHPRAPQAPNAYTPSPDPPYRAGGAPVPARPMLYGHRAGYSVTNAKIMRQAPASVMFFQKCAF